MKSNSRLLVACALLGLCTATTAAARSAAEVQLAQQRFESTATAQRKLLLRQEPTRDSASESVAQGGKPEKPATPSTSGVASAADKTAKPDKTDVSIKADRQVLEDLRFVFERSVLPDVRNERLFGDIRVVVTDGWMALAEDMIRASAALKGDCLKDYERAVLETARHNRTQAAEHAKPELKAIPRSADFVASHQERDGKNDSCLGVKASELFGPVVNRRVVAGMDAMLVWLIARQVALYLETPQALPVFAETQSGERNALCPDLVADQRALAYAQSVRVDLQPAYAAVAAYAVLFASASARMEDCTRQRLGTLTPDKDKDKDEAKSKAEFVRTLDSKSTR